MSFKPEHVDSFLSLFEERKQKIRNFEGCMHLELWRDESDENIFYTYSIWDDNSDLQNYRLSELFQDTWSQVKQWFSEQPSAFSANKLMEIL